MGGDFTYQQAQMWYKNLDKLIRYIIIISPQCLTQNAHFDFNAMPYAIQITHFVMVK